MHVHPTRSGLARAAQSKVPAPRRPPEDLPEDIPKDLPKDLFKELLNGA